MDIDYKTILRTFQDEAAEHLDAIEDALVALEANPKDGEKLQAAFRAAHTLKGAARCVELEDVAQLAHRVEDAFERLRDGGVILDADLASLLLQSVDALRARVAASVERPETAPDEKAFQALDRWLAGDAGTGVEEIIAESSSAAAMPPAPASAARPAGAEKLGKGSKAAQRDKADKTEKAAKAERAAATPASKASEAPVVEPAPAARPAEPESDSAPRPEGRNRTLRVDVDKLDRMLDLMGEIAVARGRLTGLLERGQRGEAVKDAHRDADRFYMELQELVMQARMVPLGTAFRPQVRAVRDLALSQGKQVKLVCEGGEVEVDNAIIEGLRDPLTHLVRNAVDHGIESPESRRALGKDPVGTVVLKASHQGGRIVVEILDDGAGLDEARIAVRARERKICAEPERLPREELLNLILLPGFSTAEKITEVSGRGVGMDIVRRNIESLHGTLAIESERGKGARFVITLPLTLAIVDGFAVGTGGETYVLPIEAVAECVELPRSESRNGRATGVLNLRGQPLPYLRLRDFFGLGGEPASRESVVVIRHGEGRAGLAVDELHGEGQTVIKPLASLFRRVPGVSGSALLGDGRVALILDVGNLMRAALAALEAKQAAEAQRLAERPQPPAEPGAALV